MGAAVVVMALAVGSFAFAAPPSDKTGSEKAREHFQRGEAFFKLEKYNDALGEYEKGYIAKSDASFLYNIAQCHRLMGDKPAALRFYRRFLNEATRVPNRPIVEQHIRDLEKALADAPPPPPVEAPPPAPIAVPLPVASGAALATNPGAPVLMDEPPASGSSDAARPIYKRWWFWTAVGVVLIGGSIGVYAATRSSGSACEAGRTCM
jgi:tetratricopeptide (TPR) repeat protein